MDNADNYGDNQYAGQNRDNNPFGQSGQQQFNSSNYSPAQPKTWLAESILATLLCCLPFGIVGIVNAARVESLFREGRFDEAERVSSEAKKWTTWSFIAGIIYVVLIFGAYGLFFVFGALGNMRPIW